LILIHSCLKDGHGRFRHTYGGILIRMPAKVNILLLFSAAFLFLLIPVFRHLHS
jgi:hypothetical protein